MRFLKNLFGKKPAPAKKKDSSADDIRTALEDDSSPASGKEISAQSSPKEVIHYVFQQLASRTSRDQLRADLVQHGLHRQTAEEYIALVEKTLFKRG